MEVLKSRLPQETIIIDDIEVLTSVITIKGPLTVVILSQN